jgi:hypothetical protein
MHRVRCGASSRKNEYSRVQRGTADVSDGSEFGNPTVYEFFRTKAETLRHAQALAEMQLVHLLHQRSDTSLSDAVPFLAREILRLNREGETDVQHLASRAVSLLREHIQKRESALRLTSEPD